MDNKAEVQNQVIANRGEVKSASGIFIKTRVE
jgi:hypothetical protein